MNKVQCPRCNGSGEIVKRERHIPKWCQKRFHEKLKDNLSCCCNCGNRGIYHQEGDGQIIHSLCGGCYTKLFGDAE